MKIGMITEGNYQGSDQKVCEKFARQLNPDIKIESIPLGNKPNLIDKCGDTVKILLKEGCDLVLIIWDLYPAWSEEQQPCLKRDREAIQSSLKNANSGVLPNNVYLICIEAMLEEWLLYDTSALSTVLSTKTRPVTITSKLNGGIKPKAFLRKLFKEKAGKAYNEVVDAEKIVNEISNFNKLKRCPSFARFAFKITGKNL